jgi:hypothetical protein
MALFSRIKKSTFGVTEEGLTVLCLGLLWATFAFCRLRPIYWEDVWWHLGVGQYIVEHLRVPTTDVFSWTVRGAPWINTEWLYEVILYGLVQAVGLAGVTFLKTGLMLAALYFLDRRLRLWNAGGIERLCFLGLTFLGGWPFWVERPDLSSLALLSALFFHIDRDIAESCVCRKTAILWILLFGFWPNIHGAFPAGLVVVSLYAVFVVRLSSSHGRRVIGWALGCAVATLINPYGIGLASGIFRNLSGHVEQIPEWLPPHGLPFLFFFVSLGLTIVSFLLKKKRTWDDAYAAGIVLLFASYTLRHARFVHFFMVCAFPYAAHQWLKSQWRTSLAERLIPWRITTLTAASVALFAASVISARRIQGGVSLADSGYVKEACNFIDAQKIAGPFYNEYKFGSYWIWRFKGDPPVYQDGRQASVLGYDRLMEETLQAQQSPKTWNTFMDARGIRAALVKYPPLSAGIHPAVFDQYFPRKSWGLAYWDDLCLIFVRRNPDHASLLRQWEYRVMKPDWTLESFQDQLRRGRLDRPALRKELDRNLALNPDCWRARVDLHWLNEIERTLARTSDSAVQ